MQMSMLDAWLSTMQVDVYRRLLGVRKEGNSDACYNIAEPLWQVK